MSRLNDYHIEELELSALKRFFVKEGAFRVLKKHDYLVRQNEMAACVGYVVKGMFRFVRTDALGNEHIVGYSLQDGFVGEYSSCLCSRPALADIQAIVESEIWVVSYEKIQRFWELSTEHQRLGRMLAEQLFVMSYRRLMDSYCCTPEERYIDLMKRYPDLKELRPLKEIASFIGVTPETVSAIRRKLLKSGKS